MTPAMMCLHIASFAAVVAGTTLRVKAFNPMLSYDKLACVHPSIIICPSIAVKAWSLIYKTPTYTFSDPMTLRIQS